MITLAEVRRGALSLDEVTEEPHFDYSSFRVRGKIFVTVPPDGEYIHLFLPPEERDAALEAHADYLEELWWGKKVVGLRATLALAEAGVVQALVRRAWEHKSAPAPRRKKAK